MTHHRWIRIAILLAALFALSGLAVALAQEAPAGPPALTPEWEPNNDFDTATPLYELTKTAEGVIAPTRDKDFFLFDVYPPLRLDITVNLPAGSRLKPVLRLYDGNEQQLGRATCTSGVPCLSYTPTEFAYFFVQITDKSNRGGSAYGYSIIMAYHDPNEPNDTPAEATPIMLGDETWGVFDDVGDVEYFSFPAEAGDEFEINAGSIDFWLYGPNGEELGYYPGAWQPILQTKQSGVHYLRVTGDYLAPYSFRLRPVERPLLVSFATAGTLGGVAFEPGDVMLYSRLADTWTMAFDASDMGLTGNLVGLDYDGRLELTYDKVQQLPLGTVRPQDALRFHGDTVDGLTSGELTWEFDGSDYRLTQAGEAIDALGRGENPDQIAVSTRGATTYLGYPGNRRAQANDVLMLVTDWSGQTPGHLYTALDGAALGLDRANLVALSGRGYRPFGWYMMFDRPVTLEGVTYERNDVIFCWVAENPCEGFELVYDSAFFGGYQVDAIALMPYEYD